MPRAKKDANATSTPKKTSTRAKKPAVNASGAAAAPAVALESAEVITTTVTETTTGATATTETIRQRAYQLFIERGAGHGNDLDDWYRAEAEFRKKSA